VGRREGTLEDVVKTSQGCRVFLTGHTGFKGSWLALWLSRLGGQLRGCSGDPCTEPDFFNLACVDTVVEDVRGDVRDYAKLEASMMDFAPEVAFHLAVQPIVRRSYPDPVATCATNVMGTVHLLEAIRKTPSVRAVVGVTTDKCYQNQGWIWPYCEIDPLGGHDPYAPSKACAEIVSAAYRTSFFPPDRLQEHPCGPDYCARRYCHWPRRLVRRQAHSGSSSRILLGTTRSDQAAHLVLGNWRSNLRMVIIHDAGSGTLAQNAQFAKFATAFNFGPSDEDIWPVERIATKLVQMWGDGASRIRDSVPSGMRMILRLDASKLRVELGWQARLRIEAALQKQICRI
jgi:CDP-glucose 4,6-dehydratase